MNEVFVSLGFGAGVVRLDSGRILVTHDVSQHSGAYVREEDPSQPVKSWVDENRSVVGGLLPPGAVSAEAVDDRGSRVQAAVGNGAYVAILGQRNDGHEPIVCCRDTDGRPVRRAWAQDYPSVRVTDAVTPCPACGENEYDEYQPWEEWRGGSGGKVDGSHVASPVVSCRVCGQEEREGTFMTSSSGPTEDEAARAARMARVHAEHRRRRWHTLAEILPTADFPIYAADGWPVQIGGHATSSGQLTEVRVDHHETAEADPWAGDRPRLTVSTQCHERHLGLLDQLRTAFQNWVGHDDDNADWPEASHAAITLWLRARERERNAAALNAPQSEQVIAIDDGAAEMLTLTGSSGRWVGGISHGDLTIIIAGRNVEPNALALQTISAADVLGAEPHDA